MTTFDPAKYAANKDRIQEQLRAIEGLQFHDAITFFSAQATERDRAIYELCPDNMSITPGEGVVVSECEDDHAWVLAWVLVDLDGEDLPAAQADQ